MGMFRTNAHPVLDPTFSLQPGLLDPSLVANSDMAVYDPALSLDLTSMPPTAFDQMSSVPPNLRPDPASKPETPDSNPANGAAAEPLPTDFPAQNAQHPSSTLTEFTKRRNWSQRVLEELRDFLYILTPDGRILYVSFSAKHLTGYDPADLIGKSVSEFVHPDDSALYIREFNESIATGNALRFFHRFRTAEDKYRIFECHGHPHLTNEPTLLEQTGPPVGQAGYCRGFFMMARPYPTRNSELLDSFLEHKIENVRLQARIAALKREEAEDVDGLAEHYHKPSGVSQSRTSSISADQLPPSPSVNSVPPHPDFGSMPPPSKPTVSNIALTREALDEANASARPDSIRDKMARYEGSSHVDSIEMLTGLRYRDGERSQGISTGGASPALIRGDAGIHIPIDKADPRYGHADKKHKKVKSADEYVCIHCGTLDSPEWRKGPTGPKTLCNACGLRWAKNEKKKSGSGPGIVEVMTAGASANGNTATAGPLVKNPSPGSDGRPLIKRSGSHEST